MLVFDKSEIRKSLTIENIYDLLNDWGGDPQYTSFGVVSATICHNLPGVGSRKLYYYTNTDLFHCYTGCEDPSFDIFELCTKVMRIQFDKEFDLNDAVMWIARRFGLSGSYQEDEDEKLEDWKIFSKYSHIKELEVKENHVILNEYNPDSSDYFKKWMNFDTYRKVVLTMLIQDFIQETMLLQFLIMILIIDLQDYAVVQWVRKKLKIEVNIIPYALINFSIITLLE